MRRVLPILKGMYTSDTAQNVGLYSISDMDWKYGMADTHHSCSKSLLWTHRMPNWTGNFSPKCLPENRWWESLKQHRHNLCFRKWPMFRNDPDMIPDHCHKPPELHYKCYNDRHQRGELQECWDSFLHDYIQNWSEWHPVSLRATGRESHARP